MSFELILPFLRPLEPLLFYVLHRASNEIADPGRLATFKIFLLDEAWLFIKNETIRNYVVQAQKTWRKHNAAMILATQSIKLASTVRPREVNEADGPRLWRRGLYCQSSPI